MGFRALLWFRSEHRKTASKASTPSTTPLAVPRASLAAPDPRDPFPTMGHSPRAAPSSQPAAPPPRCIRHPCSARRAAHTPAAAHRPACPRPHRS